MKQQKKVNSQAGSLKRKTTITKLIGEISKSASMLLIAVAGFGMMSFTQDDTSVNSIDSNLGTKQETTNTINAVALNSAACCGLTVAKPGDEIKKALYVSMPATNKWQSADKEAASRFEAEVSSRRLWSMDIADAIKKADAEINFNFNISKMVPSVEAGKIADAEMFNIFTDEIVKTANFTALHVSAADAEMMHNFVTEQLSAKAFNLSATLIAGADMEMKNAFEKANLHISLPSNIAAYKADIEMIQIAQLSEVQTVATK